jgi:hypothetical protein
MITQYITQTIKWIRSQVIGILIAIIGLLAAAVYAAPYSPSAFGYAKYDASCAGFTNDFGNDVVFCVKIDTTTGDSSCRYSSDVTNNWGNWSNCHSSSVNGPW